MYEESCWLLGLSTIFECKEIADAAENFQFLVLSTLLCPKVSKAYIIYIRYFLIEPNKNPDPYIITLDDS